MRESAGVREAFRGFVDAFNRADLDAVVGACAATDTVLVTGTHAEEWAVGKEAVEALFRDELGRFRLVVDDLRAWEQGDVGWIAAQMRYVHEEGETQARATGVALHDRGAWTFVQLHAHIVPDE